MASIALLMLVGVAILLLVASMLLQRDRKRRGSKLPPGNMGWPFIGETLSFIKTHPINTVGAFMEQHMSRFGKIFSTNMLGKLVIISVDPELNKFVMKNDMRLFDYGWPRAFNTLMGELSLPLLSGDAHKHMRSIVFDFLSSQRLRSVFLQDAQQIASMLLSSWEGSVISATEEANKFSFYIMGKEILSMAAGGTAIEKLRMLFEVFSAGLISLPLYIPGTTYWKAMHSRAKILEVFNQYMEERMTEQKDDYLCWVMRRADYSKKEIGDLMLHTLFAGHHTTSRAISLMIYFLEGCPKAIEALRVRN